MRQLIYFPLICMIFLFVSCRLIQTKPTKVDKRSIKEYPNLVETSPGYYMEFAGLKNYSAQQIVDSMAVKQDSTFFRSRGLHACAAFLEGELGFEYASSNSVKPNYSIINLIESKKDYGIIEKPLSSG